MSSGPVLNQSQTEIHYEISFFDETSYLCLSIFPFKENSTTIENT